MNEFPSYAMRLLLKRIGHEVFVKGIYQYYASQKYFIERIRHQVFIIGIYQRYVSLNILSINIIIKLVINDNN